MATFVISIPGSICCYEKGNERIVPGETIRLTLDDGKYPGITENPINAVINSMTAEKVWDPATNTTVDGYTYNVTVDDNEMPVVNGGVLQSLDICDVVEWACKSCCDDLGDRLDDIENATGTSYFINGVVNPNAQPNLGVITPVIGDTVVQKTNTNVYEFWDFDSDGWTKVFEIDIQAVTNGSFNVTSGDSLTDTSGGTATVSPGSVLHLWSAGGISLATVPGSAKVRIEPENITEDFLAAGAPGSPADQTRSAIHFASDGLYFWDTTAVQWRALGAENVTVHTVPVVANLNTLSALIADQDVVITQGWNTEGDGGGNHYRYDSVSAATCDGGFILDGIGGNNTVASGVVSYAGIGTGRFIALNQNYADVYKFGSVGDGVADDRFRIQAAIDAMEAVGSGDVLFPPGTFVHSGITVTDNDVRLIGSGLPADLAGGGSTIIYGSGDPEGVVSAVIGSIFQRLDGTAGTAFFIKGTGSGNTGWYAIPGQLAGSDTYDPPSLADGSGDTTTVTVTGAALGDFSEVSFSLDTQGITITSWVSAANTVSVRFQNESGGLLDLASGTLRAIVRKM